MMAEEVFEKTKEYLSRLAGTVEGQAILARHDQDIGFEVTRGEKFVVSVKGGKLSFRRGDVAVPASNIEDFTQNMKVIADKETFFELYSGDLRPIDALIPEGEAAVRLNIYPYLPKLRYVRWITEIIKLIAKQKQQSVPRRSKTSCLGPLTVPDVNPL